MEKELYNDFVEFTKAVGAAEELSDRGWKEEVWCSDSYQDTIDIIFKKYLPEDAEAFVPITPDDYLYTERLVRERFELIILE